MSATRIYPFLAPELDGLVSDRDMCAYDYVIGSTSGGLDAGRLLIALRSARAQGPAVYAAVMRLAMRKRAEYRTTVTLRQRDWQASTSRRPARGRHHDSWAIRERYVRCA